ncbi:MULTISPECIES: ArnT family glycosyltransferase [unclassified Nitrospina]|uniref:ArnT family glycosyltransferase n=1 Tax=unclassified Nitrospina TaxID=2638683 RepID=UPI003F99B097
MRSYLTHPFCAPAALIGLYALTRLYSLLGLPMVFDEAIYLRWADIIRNDPASLFVSAVDGKPPFFFWLNAITLGWFDDLLVSSRMISVVAGGLAVAGLWRIGALLFSRHTAGLAAFIYLSLPLVLTHDRLGLTDALLATFVIWTVYAGLRLARDDRPSWRWTFALGMFAGLGFLTKTPLLMFLALPVMAVFLFNHPRNLELWIRLSVSGVVFGLLALPFLLHEPDYLFSNASKVLHHKVPLLETLAAVLTFDHPRLLPHLRELFEVGLLYITVPVMILAVMGTGVSLRTQPRTAAFLLLWLFLPTAVFLILAEVAYPRYFLVGVPPLAILTAEGLRCLMRYVHETLKPRSPLVAGTAAIALGVACLIPAWKWNIHYLTEPETAAWTELDHWQYVRYPQGPYAVTDAVHFLKNESRNGPIAVFTTFKLGIPSDALYMYLKDQPGIDLYEAWRPVSFPHSLKSAREFVTVSSKYQPKKRRVVPVQELEGKRLYFVGSLRMFPLDRVVEKNPELRLVKLYDDMGPYEVFSFAIFEWPGGVSSAMAELNSRS